MRLNWCKNTRAKRETSSRYHRQFKLVENRPGSRRTDLPEIRYVLQNRPVFSALPSSFIKCFNLVLQNIYAARSAQASKISNKCETTVSDLPESSELSRPVRRLLDLFVRNFPQHFSRRRERIFPEAVLCSWLARLLQRRADRPRHAADEGDESGRDRA